jgi:cytochrome c biogenesis protein CcmG/thiol:disulfide interchange protein DsbE
MAATDETPAPTASPAPEPAARGLDPRWGVLVVALLSLATVFWPRSDAGSAEAPPAAEGGFVFDAAGRPTPLGREMKPVTLVHFWATWCPPCVAELPELVAVVREHESGGLQVLGVSFDMMLPGKEPDDVVAHVRTFLEQRGLVLPTVVLDRADYKSIRARYDLPDGIPVTLAIDRAGNVVDRHEGQGAREDFERLARKALGR